jgi:succinate dehydrogenase / fumarate reductase flavoprotein subunit
MYEKITADDPYQTPMMIYPAIHYTMGGLWVDYNLMSTVPGLFVLGEANFSDHGANRLGASALMQGLADGYFVLPYTIGGYLAGTAKADVTTGHKAFDESEKQVTGRIENCCPSTASARWTTSIKPWDASCGNTAVWPETTKALRWPAE